MMRFVNLLASVYTVCFVASAVSADMYKYTHDSGSVVITNQLENVPKKYQTSLKVVKEELPLSQQKLLPEVERMTTYPPPSTDAVQPQSVAQKENPDITDAVRKKYINTGFVLAGIVAGYFILTRLTGSLGFPRMGMIAFLFFVLTGGVYLYNLYLKEMSAVFSDLRKNALGMKKNVEMRENKTEQIFNKLPEAE